MCVYVCVYLSLSFFVSCSAPLHIIIRFQRTDFFLKGAWYWSIILRFGGVVVHGGSLGLGGLMFEMPKS